MAQLHPAVKAFFQAAGRKGGAAHTEAQIEAARRNGAMSPGREGPPIEAQVQAFKDMCGEGYRPHIGAKLHKHIIENSRSGALKRLAESCKADHTAWTLLKRAHGIKGEAKSSRPVKED